MFWFDSLTINSSIACEIARKNAVFTGQRDMFIDARGGGGTDDLVRNLALRALYAPHIPHLAIGHVRPSTADGLKRVVAELKKMDVEVTPISRCLSQVIEADFQPKGTSVTRSGNWSVSSSNRLSKELHDGYSMHAVVSGATKPNTITFTPSIPKEALYDIYTTWIVDQNNASGIIASVSHEKGMTHIGIDQAKYMYDWVYLGRFTLPEGSASSVTFSDSKSQEIGKAFRADAVKFVYAGPLAIQQE